MNEQEEFFSPNHKRLLSIAVWARYLAWVVLVIYFFWAIGTYLQEQNMFMYYRAVGSTNHSNFIGLLKGFPFYGLSVFIEMIGVFLKGIVYFLVLKGISLGINMIVETDINYREQKGGTQ